MDPTKISTQVCVKHCSLCQGDTEYYCHHCQHNLCLQCKKKHVIDIDTKNHEVTRYAEKTKIPPKQVMSARSRDSDNREPCGVPVSDPCPEHVMSARSGNSDNREPCEIPVNDFYPKHRPWRFLPPVWLSPLENSRHDEMKRRLYSERIYHLRGETLYYRHVMLEELRHDVKCGHKEVTKGGQGKAKERAQVLKDLIDEVLTGNLYDRCQIQKTRLSKHIDRLEKNERRYEEYSCRLPVEYLRFIKHKPDPRKNEQKLIKVLVQMMKRMKLSTETRKRQAGNKLLLTLLPSPVLQKSTTVKAVKLCSHISCVTPDRVWVSDLNSNLILTDTTTGDKLHSVEDSLRYSWKRIHTVNSECELIYIEKDYDINKLSSDMKTTTTFIKKPKIPWIPWCVYCSPSSGDLLVGMFRYDRKTRTRTGEVWRYNNTGKLTQTIPHNNTDHKLYEIPIYITENNNGDVVVSDNLREAVVVTDCEGRHRFSYTGPPSGSGLTPWGICTDALSHILVCDHNTHTVQMINKDGDFLSYLLTTESPGIHHGIPVSLSYDVNTHTLYVGSWNNTVSVYRYINRHLTITDNVEVCDGVSVPRSSPSQSIPGFSQEEFDILQSNKKTRRAAEEATEEAARAKCKCCCIS